MKSINSASYLRPRMLIGLLFSGVSKPMNSHPLRKNAVVVGASGGIGFAVVEQLLADQTVDKVYTFSRTPIDVKSLDAALSKHSRKLVQAHIDLESEASIAEMPAQLMGVSLDMVLICSGLLHSQTVAPEKTIRQVKQSSLQQLFQVNAIAPILIAQQLSPLLRKDTRSVIGVISARVGSISDNQLGGWYGYRASKSAVHMFFKTLSIELKRKLPKAVVCSLHPGTVNTNLSKPFQARVPEGKLFTPHQSAGYLLKVVTQLTPEDSGKVFAWDGSEITP